MLHILNLPAVLCVCTMLCLWGSAQLGTYLGRKFFSIKEGEWEQFGMILGATLTLLGLLIGFSFSMSISRYDQRKNYEEEEANAIGTEYVRADLLPESTRTTIKGLLVEYLDLRIKRYKAHAIDDVSELAAKTAQVQDEMWSGVKDAAVANPSPITAVVVSGMNDVINRQGYTQAARLNRIPFAAWALMTAIALFTNFLIGFGEKGSGGLKLLILPIAVSISFFLIADIDSPQGGLIRIQPQNLQILADSLRSNSNARTAGAIDRH